MPLILTDVSLKTHISNRPVLPSWAIAPTPLRRIHITMQNPMTYTPLYVTGIQQRTPHSAGCMV